MSKKYFYPVIFEPEEVGVSVYVPDIPGCNTQGDSLEEALEMVQEVIGLMLEGKKPEEYPQASKPNEINRALASKPCPSLYAVRHRCFAP